MEGARSRLQRILSAEQGRVATGTGRQVADLFGALVAAQPSAQAEPLVTNAQHAYIVDYQTGSVLFDKLGTERLHPASMSKLMTIYMLFDALKRGDVKLTDTFHVSEKAWSTQGSKMFVEINSSIAVEDLIRGIIIQSGNDACVAMAEFLAGSTDSFASLMNAWAAKLGMKDSQFKNPHGLDEEGHYSTARDMARLPHSSATPPARRALHRFRRSLVRHRAVVAARSE